DSEGGSGGAAAGVGSGVFFSAGCLAGVAAGSALAVGCSEPAGAVSCVTGAASVLPDSTGATSAFAFFAFFSGLGSVSFSGSAIILLNLACFRFRVADHAY